MTIDRALHRNVNIGTTLVELLPQNPARSYCLIQNDSDTAIYLGLGFPVAVNQGIRINASGGYFEINRINPYTGRIFAITSAATKKVMVTEY